MHTLFPYTTLFRSQGPSALLWRRRRGGEAGRGLRAPQPVRPRAREPRHLPLAPAGGAAVAQRRKARALSPPQQPPCSGLTPRIRGYRSINCPLPRRSEEHTSELQSLMRISYAVFCLKKKKTKNTNKR